MDLWKIVPAVGFTRLEEVFVILEQRQIPEEASFSAVDEGLWPATPKVVEAAKAAPEPPKEPQKPAAAPAPRTVEAPMLQPSLGLDPDRFSLLKKPLR